MTTTSDVTDSTKIELGFAFREPGGLPDIQPVLRRLAHGDAAAADAASALAVQLWDEAGCVPSDGQRSQLLALRHELQWALATMESSDPRVLVAKAWIVDGIFREGEPAFMDDLTETLARGLEQLAEARRREDRTKPAQSAK